MTFLFKLKIVNNVYYNVNIILQNKNSVMKLTIKSSQKIWILVYTHLHCLTALGQTSVAEYNTVLIRRSSIHYDISKYHFQITLACNISCKNQLIAWKKLTFVLTFQYAGLFFLSHWVIFYNLEAIFSFNSFVHTDYHNITAWHINRKLNCTMFFLVRRRDHTVSYSKQFPRANYGLQIPQN